MQDSKIITLGCRLNAYESEVIRGLIKNSTEEIVVVNTCSVTAEAERQARQEIRKLRRENTNAKIVVTGCSAQLHPEQYNSMPEVDRVLGNHDKFNAEHYIFASENTEKVIVNDIMSIKETAGHLISDFHGRSRAFIQVQNGCNHRCTFCNIPFARGNSRSVALGDIIKQVELLLENGYQELVLTGVDITSYGEDLPGAPTLGLLVKRLLRLVPDLPRLRISSVDSVEIDSDLLDVVENDPRLMPHFHLSLQSGDNLILKRMKRRHSRENSINVCRELRQRRPDMVFGADFIVGFPTETDEMFQNTMKIVDECDLTFLHVFPYSKREETPASRMPQVNGEAIRKRSKMLRDLGAQKEKTFLTSLVGSTVQVLCESKTIGRTERFAPVCMSQIADAQEGKIYTMKIQKITEGKAIGELV
jgi:threonylcarbamoyladenosine tRNA methylthiotransferase MtaB